MCLGKVYLKDKDNQELLLDSVSHIKIEDRRILLTTLFGDEKEVEAGIKEIDFQSSNIILEKIA